MLIEFQSTVESTFLQINTRITADEEKISIVRKELVNDIRTSKVNTRVEWHATRSQQIVSPQGLANLPRQTRVSY